MTEEELKEERQNLWHAKHSLFMYNTYVALLDSCLKILNKKNITSANLAAIKSYIKDMHDDMTIDICNIPALRLKLDYIKISELINAGTFKSEEDYYKCLDETLKDCYIYLKTTENGERLYSFNSRTNYFEALFFIRIITMTPRVNEHIAISPTIERAICLMDGEGSFLNIKTEEYFWDSDYCK